MKNFVGHQTHSLLDLPFSQTTLTVMYKFTQSSKKLRLISSRLGSLLLVLQRTPLVQWLLPEAPLASGIGASKELMTPSPGPPVAAQSSTKLPPKWVPTPSQPF
jgi:hypothetical protein